MPSFSTCGHQNALSDSLPVLNNIPPPDEKCWDRLFTIEGHSACDTILSVGDGISDAAAIEVVVMVGARVNVIVGRGSIVAVEIRVVVGGAVSAIGNCI